MNMAPNYVVRKTNDESKQRYSLDNEEYFVYINDKKL